MVATNIKTGERRILSGCESEAEAEAIVKMAVMRRGVDVEFFKVEPDNA
ncbi:MAG TPA: hypothetical protein VFL96_07810 [Acidobacteriaceae bacterium]|nr:hypothetical protein [Acidobacteriaceae bacterium]